MASEIHSATAGADGLRDYQDVAAGFSLDALAGTLAGSLNQGLNACVECCDRHVGPAASLTIGKPMTGAAPSSPSPSSRPFRPVKSVAKLRLLRGNFATGVAEQFQPAAARAKNSGVSRKMGAQ
jgi:hypothetical protein